MDELALLKAFRAADAAPNGAREHARRVVRAALARRRRRRRYALVAAFVGAAVLAGGAYGLVRQLLVGDPAPPEVRAHLARAPHRAELIPFPHPDDPIADRAAVAAVLDGSAGRAYLFSVPTARSLCGYLWVEGERNEGEPDLSSVCGEPGEPFFALLRDGRARTFMGHTGGRAERVALRYGDRELEIGLAGDWYLAEITAEPDEVLFYDAGGSVVERYAVPAGQPRAGEAAPIPKQVTRAREVVAIRAREGERITLHVARADSGDHCVIVRSDRRPSNRGCSTPPPAPTALGVHAMNFGGAPGGVLLLVGPVGADVAEVKLRYEDGRVAGVPLHAGWVLHEIAEEDYAPGRRPVELVARDAAGALLDAERLPWAGG